METQTYKSTKEIGYDGTKNVVIKKIDGIELINFRGIENETIELGSYITVLAGKNGTMKSTMLGLIAHPFTSPNGAKDILGHSLKTNLSDVFRLSPEKDNARYSYNLCLTTGFDSTNIECVFIARPTQSVVLYSQMLGRGLRGPQMGGNEECLLIDIKDNLKQYNEHMAFSHFSSYWNLKE